MYTEILTTTVRKDFEIKGISVGSTECKLSQFADDTTFILGFFTLGLPLYARTGLARFRG